MRTRPLPSLVALLAVLAPAGASAHDSNLARWDVQLRADAVVLELRTSRHAIDQSLRDAFPEMAHTSFDTPTYEALVARYVSASVRPEQGSVALGAPTVSVVLGHESVVTMVFAREQDAARSSLRFDLRGFSARPNQHHLVYFNGEDGRQRLMLRPDDEPIIRWSEASGLTRVRAGDRR